MHASSLGPACCTGSGQPLYRPLWGCCQDTPVCRPPTASVSPAAITHLSDEIQYRPLRIASHRHQPQCAPRGVLAMDVSAPPFAGQPGSRVFTLMPQKGHQSCYITITSDCLHRQVTELSTLFGAQLMNEQVYLRMHQVR